MPKAELPSRLQLAAALVFIAMGAPALAQDEPEEELETIAIGDRYDVQGDSQGYRLIEDAEQADDWVEPESEREQQAEELRRLFELYREALQNKAYLEADTLAKRVVELSIRLNGLDSHDSAKAITNLGIAQHNNKDYESALRNFTASIDIIERIDDRLSPALINPLQGLAATQAATGRPDLARQSFQRAVHVSHVNDGPHNPGQIDTLESMAELYISAGEFDEAVDIQEHIFAIQSRNIDPDSLALLPALEKRARWQHRLQMYHRERVSWRQVINIIEEHRGKEDLSLIAPLTELGKSHLYVTPIEYDFQPDLSSGSGETYLRRANRIADENPDSTWQIINNTLVSLGDYYVLSGRPNRASKIYRESWDLLSAEEEDQERLSIRRDIYSQPVLLQSSYPPKYYNVEREDTGQDPPGNFSTGTISLGYTVMGSGRIANIQHIETQPKEIEDFDKVIARNLRRRVYRPRLEEGQMVQSHDMVFTHEFFYEPSDLPPSGGVTEDSEESEESPSE